MSKSVAVKKNFTFVGGLNTEASPLTYPPNTWADGDNVVPDIDGSISLRMAVDFENGYSLSSAVTDTQEQNGAFTAGEWNNVAGNGNRHFLVMQRDTTVSFYVNSGDTISNQAKSFTIDLSSYKAAGSTETSGVAPISCTTLNGRLLICSRDTEPLLVTYSESGDSISVSAISIQFRDFIGSGESTPVDTRPGALTASHQYDLLNQGWNNTVISSYQAGAGVFPSNAQSWTAGKDASDNFSQALLDKQDFGTSPAPKGRFVLNLFNRDRSTVSGVGGLTTETETYRPTASAFFAGRAWYAGIKSSTIGTWVMFSQVAETNANLGKCYQDADPTSEVVSDLVASDGGVIPIQDAGTVVKLVPYGNSVLVIADNGVWQVLGGGVASGFAADNYEVRKLSAFGCVSAKSVVVTDKGIFYWGEDAVYAITQNDAGNLIVSPITPGTVQTLYDDIPMTGKLFSTGVFVPSSRLIVWLFNSDSGQNGLQFRFKKNRMLVLDTRLNAFYTHTVASLASLTPYLVDVFITRSRSTSSVSSNVVDSSTNMVVDGSSNQVVATLTPDVVASSVDLKFMALAPQTASSIKAAVAEFNDTDDAPIKWRDWYHHNTAGITFNGFLLPGYDFGANQGGDKAIQQLYVMTYFRRTETGIDASGNAINPSSCSLRARWDWSDSSSSNRWSTAREVYRHTRPWMQDPSLASYDDGVPVVVTKNKVRGRGKAVQLHFSSSPDNDMQMLGWAVTFIGNENV